MKIYFANDHAGVELKKQLIKYFENQFECINLGCDSDESVDYPDFAEKLAKEFGIQNSDEEGHLDAIGVIICGSGLGISMAANRFSNIRAALCHNVEYAKLAREHNDANVIAFGARFIDQESAISCIKEFISTQHMFGRHAKRVEKLSKLP